jgi:hypothetical protein
MGRLSRRFSNFIPVGNGQYVFENLRE